MTHHGLYEMGLLCTCHQGSETACASPAAEVR